MNTELENLINMALADGEVTEKERAIILKKAESLAIDKDEVEMILDGKIALMQKEQNAKQLKETGAKSNKAGELKKCPSCGAPVESFNTKCVECGYEFTGIEASKTIRMLFEKLDSIEKERDTIKIGGIVGLLGSIDETTKQRQVDEIITKKKAAIIRNFPIPNTREELLELIHFINPKINKNANSDSNYYDWKAKFSELIGRAKFAYKNDKSMLLELQEYEKSSKGNLLLYFKHMDKKKRFIIIYIIFSVLFFSFVIISVRGCSSNHDKGVEKEKARLEIIMNKVNDAISKKEYESALIYSAQLKWEYSDSYKSDDTKELIKAWDEKREKIIDVITIEKNTKDFK